MPPKLKRPWTSLSRPVSPPASKRKTVSSDEASCSPDEVDGRFRVFSWNVNGVGVFLQKQLNFNPNTEFPLRIFLKRHRWPHLLCLQEVKIAFKDEATQRRLTLAANAGCKPNEPTYTIHFSLPRDKYNATGFKGKVYGVASLIRDDFAHHVKVTRRPDWDLEGRILIHEMSSGLFILNGYWVNGTDNLYRNPTTGHIQGTRHDHKLRFHNNVLDEALTFQNLGGHVLLIGDMNIAPDLIDGHPNLRVSPVQHVENRADFNHKFLTKHGLDGIDVFRKFHAKEKKYTYYPRGRDWGESCDRVDLIIATRNLFDQNAVVSCDICDNLEDRGHSDHVPLWVEIDLANLVLSHGKSE